MSTLSVSSIQNTASPTTNIVVNADGSVTLGLYRTPSVAPTPVQIGTLWYDIGGAGLVIWNGSSWAGVGGGGGGTVTGVTGTLPIVSTGGTAPILSINAATNATAGSMSAADKTKLDGAATIVSAVTGTLPITVATGTSTPVIAINAATAAAAGSIEIATLAEAAAGTDATRASTPETAVPKDASGMTGAAILPSGTLLQRPAAPVAGMQRFNTDTGNEEVYTGATLGWQNLAYSVAPATLVDVTIPTGASTLSPSYYCKNFTVTAGATLTCLSQGTYIRATGDVTINASTWTLVGVPGATQTAAVLVLGSSGYGLGAGLAGSSGANGRPYYVIAQLGGSSGGSGTTTNAGTIVNQGGGYAGGYIVILADGDVTFNGTVAMNCPGGPGISTSGFGGGGGGGSGGCIIISSQKTITTPASVTFDVSGGNGSNGINDGGADAAGGGGGGGGWVILQSANLVDSSVKNLAGGAAGLDSGGGALRAAGGGGSYAGAGGRPGSTSFTPGAGGSGVFALGYIPT